MESEDFVAAAIFLNDHVRNYFVGRDELFRMGLHQTKGFQSAIMLSSDVSRGLKGRGIVPEEAGLVGYFCCPQRAGFVLRFVHASFSQVKPGDMIPEFEVSIT